MSTSIENAVALVTGSNRGIGSALVHALLARGAAKVYAAARSIDSLAELTARYGSRVAPIALDVTSPEQAAAAAAQADDVTIVISNAGYLGGADLFAAELAPARQEFEVNYWGALNVARAFAPALRANGGGALVTVSSVAGLSNFPVIPTYSDSKAAVHSLVTGLRHLLAGQGTQVVGVYPGPVDTDMAREIELEKATPESVADAILDGIASGAEDIFPDVFAQGYAASYEAGYKPLERMIAGMIAPAA